MADVQDVLDTLVTQIAGYVYPNGTSQPPVAGTGIRVYSDWPMPQQLDADLPQNIIHVSVFAPGVVQNTTRYRPKQMVMSIAAPMLTLTAAANVVTVGGAMPSPFTAHNLALLINSQPFIYSVQATDTLTSIATAFATLLNQTFSGTTSSGPVVTLPAGTVPIVARVGTTGIVSTEWERQQELFQVSVWAPDSMTRKTVGAAIRSGFAPIHDLTMVDGFGANIKFRNNRLSDDPVKVGISRRDLFYQVEYATTTTQTLATVVATKVTYETQSGVPIITRTY